MTILITGGTGFIGAEIVRMLVAQGRDDVVVAHRSGNFLPYFRVFTPLFSIISHMIFFLNFLG